MAVGVQARTQAVGRARDEWKPALRAGVESRTRERLKEGEDKAKQERMDLALSLPLWPVILSCTRRKAGAFFSCPTSVHTFLPQTLGSHSREGSLRFHEIRPEKRLVEINVR